RRGLKGELHRCRHVLVLGVVFAIACFERADWIHCSELPGAAPRSAARQAQEVLGATANFEIMAREGGGREGRPPEPFEVPWVGKGVPEALLRNRKVPHNGEGERCGVFGDRGQWHRQYPSFPFGRRTSSSCARRWRQMDSK